MAEDDYRPGELPEDQAGERPLGKRSRIREAVNQYNIDLDHCIVGSDMDEESDRIYLIEDMRDDGYRLYSYGLDEDGRPAAEIPIRIPETAVGVIQGLMHAVGMHVVEHQEQERPITLRDVSEEMGLSEPLKPEAGEPRAQFDTDEDADPDRGP